LKAFIKFLYFLLNFWHFDDIGYDNVAVFSKFFLAH